MTRPAPGLMATHNGIPVEFLYLVGADRDGQTWRVRPLFIEAPEIDRHIRTYDRITPLHIKFPR